MKYSIYSSLSFACWTLNQKRVIVTRFFNLNLKTKLIMKPTLNEEIGMSQEGIDYVNSLEVKESEIISQRIETNKKLNAILNNPKTHDFMISIEKQRIKKQSQKVWAFVFLAIVIIVTYFLNTKN